MTCVVGIAEAGSVWIGADSAATGGYAQTIRADTKVFTKPGFVFGFCGSFRMGQLLRYRFNPPERLPSQGLEEYMVTSFIDGVRSCLAAGGWKTVRDGVEWGGVFLVGHGGELFEVDCDFQVGRPADNMAAIGCGEEYAYGALHVVEGCGDPEWRIRLALGAAERRSVGVAGPFVIERGGEA